MSTVYNLHRDLVVQAPEHKWELLCVPCFGVSHLKEIYGAPREDTVQALEMSCNETGTRQTGSGNPLAQQSAAWLPPFTTHRIASSTQPNKFYEVTIYPDKVLCTCPWAMYTSNQDQGRTQKFCSHILKALKAPVT